VILPARMRHKIRLELCPDPTLPGRCWTWKGAIQSKGYGSFGYRGRIWSTHRLAYELMVGPIPEGLTIDHLCLNKRCCSPRHLEPVTLKENMRRAREGLHHPRPVKPKAQSGPTWGVTLRDDPAWAWLFKDEPKPATA
jgi:hypothetical protein